MNGISGSQPPFFSAHLTNQINQVLNLNEIFAAANEADQIAEMAAGIEFSYQKWRTSKDRGVRQIHPHESALKLACQEIQPHSIQYLQMIAATAKANRKWIETQAIHHAANIEADTAKAKIDFFSLNTKPLEPKIEQMHLKESCEAQKTLGQIQRRVDAWKSIENQLVKAKSNVEQLLESMATFYMEQRILDSYEIERNKTSSNLPHLRDVMLQLRRENLIDPKELSVLTWMAEKPNTPSPSILTLISEGSNAHLSLAVQTLSTKFGQMTLPGTDIIRSVVNFRFPNFLGKNPDPTSTDWVEVSIRHPHEDADHKTYQPSQTPQAAGVAESFQLQPLNDTGGNSTNNLTPKLKKAPPQTPPESP